MIMAKKSECLGQVQPHALEVIGLIGAASALPPRGLALLVCSRSSFCPGPLAVTLYPLPTDDPVGREAWGHRSLADRPRGLAAELWIECISPSGPAEEADGKLRCQRVRTALGFGGLDPGGFPLPPSGRMLAGAAGESGGARTRNALTAR